MAEETNNQISATVRFPDGFDQTVILPLWATKQNIKDEARRLRDEADAKANSRKPRPDLTE